ncbi:hypothetical protein LCGC14_1365790 [marine sediment metagenome]|uniref:Uncharacterized protein n=1 Tax=marine sediment metagenome TaxID=412755 RepID=A0A0F9K6W2_9ZZZZ
MIRDLTYRARNYVQRSPQCRGLSDFKRDRLIRGIAKLLSWAYKQGFEQGKAHGVGCGCCECQVSQSRKGQ